MIGILQERLDVAQRNLTMNDLHRPNHGNQQIANVFDAVHKREDQNRKELRQPGRMIVLLVFLRELGFFIFFMIKRPHDRLPSKGFLDLCVDLAELLLLRTEQFLRAGSNHANDTKTQRHDDQRNQRQLPADGQHQRQHSDKRNHTGNHLNQTLLQRGGNVVHIIDHSTHQIPIAVRIIELNRNNLHLGFNVTSQVIDHLLRNIGHDNLLCQTEKA